MKVKVPNFPAPSLPFSRRLKQERGSLDGEIRWSLAGDWSVSMLGANGTCHEFQIALPKVFRVRDEKAEGGLPEKQPTADGWLLGFPLKGVRAEECTIPGALLPETLAIKSSPGAAGPVFVRGRDYDFDATWGTVWSLPGGKLAAGQEVWMDYAHVPQRLDSAVLTRSGQVAIREGTPHPAMPEPAPLTEGERRLANFYLPGPMGRLVESHLFPILETVYPEERSRGPSPAETFLPRTMARLRSGEPLKILAWGDSVTAAGRFQPLFLAHLWRRFPQAEIELVTEAWPGKNTLDYLAESPGSGRNFAEKVLALKPDLILSEFVNDASLRESPGETRARYERIREAFRVIGAEWILLTPHYVKPNWMGLDRQRNIDDDPRPYVRFLREFARNNQIALADASRRYGRLWRQGIPYLTLMENGINHPNLAGHQILADSLLALFPGDCP